MWPGWRERKEGEVSNRWKYKQMEVQTDVLIIIFRFYLIQTTYDKYKIALVIVIEQHMNDPDVKTLHASLDNLAE